MKYRVMCKREGGTLGDKSALLKKDGMICEFKTIEEARAAAQTLMISMNNRNAVATFTYWAIEVPDETTSIN
jgi:hypothetical protein